MRGIGFLLSEYFGQVRNRIHARKGRSKSFTIINSLYSDLLTLLNLLHAYTVLTLYRIRIESNKLKYYSFQALPGAWVQRMYAGTHAELLCI